MVSQETNLLPKVTVAILSWNRFQYFKATIESARQCIQYPHLEWIVSDNQSDEPGLREYIRSLDWVQQKFAKRQSHAAAMNEIVEKAQGEFLIIWPDDVQFITKGQWLQPLVEIMSKNYNFGSVALDALRLVSLKQILQPKLRSWLPCALRDMYLYRGKVRRSCRISLSNGFEVLTAGPVMSGICGSGIPSLTRTSVWKSLGPWKTRDESAGGLIDSSLGAEENMYEQFIDSRLPLQSVFLMIPVAADIITDPLGCKAKVRGQYRYGVYMPPPDSSGLYYQVRNSTEFNTAGRTLPLNFSEMVQPLGFNFPKDKQGDRLKFALNTSVVFDIKEQRQVPYPLTIPSK